MSDATLTATLTLLLATVMPPVGALEPCPETPNCVSTLAESEEQRMPPLAFAGDAGEARELLLDVLAREPRVEITELGDLLIRTVFTTRWLRFKDDVVFLIDPSSRVIHFRSASRLGRSDLGANRRRMERISEAFRRLREGEAPG